MKTPRILWKLSLYGFAQELPPQQMLLEKPFDATKLLQAETFVTKKPKYLGRKEKD
jgi:hypothetical protein